MAVMPHLIALSLQFTVGLTFIIIKDGLRDTIVILRNTNDICAPPYMARCLEIMPKKTRSTHRHIALVYPIAVPWMAKFARGLMDYAAGHGGWSLTVSPPSLGSAGEEALTLQSLKGWPGDGVIAAIASQADLRAARRLDKPVVNITAVLPDMGLPCVLSDHYGMGQMAAEHLLQRGFRRLAYLGIDGLWYSQQRRLGFVDHAKKQGVPCEVLEISQNSRTGRMWQNRIAPLTRWLRKLRPPVGILAVQDYRACAIVDECKRLRLNVPHDVAVMGVDNDPTVCEFCQPTMTSVSRNPWRLGHEAAALLDRLMGGYPRPSKNTLVPAEGVVARESTDTIAVENVHVATAAHFIHDHLHETFNIDCVVRATTISRRQLEVQFRRFLGCTLHDYISRQRCELAKQLLTIEGRVKFCTLAKACGFSSVEHMRIVFVRMTGVTPQQYRRAELEKTGCRVPAPPHSG